MSLMATGALSRELRVVLVDDHPVYRGALEGLIADRQGLRVVGSTGTGEEAVALARGLSPDDIVMGLRLPGIDGVETTRRIRAGRTRPKVIILGVSPKTVRNLVSIVFGKLQVTDRASATAKALAGGLRA